MASRKDYVAIADIISNVKLMMKLEGMEVSFPAINYFHYLENELAEYFAKENETFDKVKFKEACF